jgi:hypothetical protein
LASREHLAQDEERPVGFHFDRHVRLAHVINCDLIM